MIAETTEFIESQIAGLKAVYQNFSFAFTS
jgi:hypothetical protein